MNWVCMPESVHVLNQLSHCIPTLYSITESLFTQNRHLGLPIRPIIRGILLGIESSDHGDIILIRSLSIRYDPAQYRNGVLTDAR